MNRIQKGGAVAVLACSVVGGAEGLRQVAYPDPATRGPPWTICYGHTGNVKPWMHMSLQQCKDLLLVDLGKDADVLERCIPSLKYEAVTPTTRYVAVASLAYNIGPYGVCKSSVARDLNAGRIGQACADFLKFNRAAGIVFPGLTRRRQQEQHLCLE